MSKATKFGYGFLFLGASLPYLIEHLFGASVALILALFLVVCGIALLYLGHIHRDKGEKPISLKSKIVIGTLLAAICMVVCFLGWRIGHMNHASELNVASPPAVPGQTIIQQQSQDSDCANIVAGRDVNCTEKKNGKAKH